MATTLMRAARVAAPRTIEMVEAPIPDIGADEIRVRLEGCGVCASNIPPWEGRSWFTYPLTPGQLGHEGWGVVDAVGSRVDSLRPGQRVAFLSDHAYAAYDTAPASAAVTLPPVLAGRPFPGEPLGCAMNIFSECAIEPGQTLAIVGTGFLGSLLTMLARRAGARIIALSRRPDGLATAQRLGADHCIPLIDHYQIIEQVRSLTGGRFCDCVVEATGKQWPLDLAAELTRERGRLVIAGFHQDGPRQVNMQLWNWRGLRVLNAHWRDQQDYIAGMRAAVDAVARGELDHQPLLSHRYPLEQLGQALQDTAERGERFMKGFVLM